MLDLFWNVFLEDPNRRCIVEWNIFEHRAFSKSVERLFSVSSDKDDFAERLTRELRYYFWSKCEYEIVLTAWPPASNFKDRKIDVFEQIMLNKNAFVDYVWAERPAYTYKATNIQYDIDEGSIDEYGLPEEIYLPWSIDDDEDAISDYISDITGFCHKGFVIEEV